MSRVVYMVFNVLYWWYNKFKNDDQQDEQDGIIEPLEKQVDGVFQFLSAAGAWQPHVIDSGQVIAR